MPKGRKGNRGDWSDLGRLMGEKYGPGLLCRDPGGRLAYFVLDGRHLSPYTLHIERVDAENAITVCALRGSPWRPGPQNGWEVLHAQE